MASLLQSAVTGWQSQSLLNLKKKHCPSGKYYSYRHNSKYYCIKGDDRGQPSREHQLVSMISCSYQDVPSVSSVIIPDQDGNSVPSVVSESIPST